jgi:hypothetical protein
MVPLVALLPVLALSSPAARPPAPGTPSLQLSARAAPAVRAELAGPLAGLRGSQDPGGAPICLGDVCQPRVAVPGHEATFREQRTELFLSLLSRVPVEGIASLAARIAASNLRIDYTPANVTPDHRGGRIIFSLRWRLDPTGPVRLPARDDAG